MERLFHYYSNLKEVQLKAYIKLKNLLNALLSTKTLDDLCMCITNVNKWS